MASSVTFIKISAVYECLDALLSFCYCERLPLKDLFAVLVFILLDLADLSALVLYLGGEVTFR